MRVLSIVLALLLAAATACGGGADDSATPDDATTALRVGRFEFPESELLAELYRLTLESAGVPVRPLEMAAQRATLAPALEQDQVDLVPEYLGFAVSHFGLGEVDSRTATVEELRDLLTPRGLTALDPAPAENVNVFVVLADSGLGPALSDLEGVASTLRLGGTTECPERDDCLAGLESTYGLHFAAFVPEPKTELRAAALRRDEIDVALLFSTDAAITDDFLVLDDDRNLQPPGNIVPVIRLDALERWGSEEVTDALNGVSAALTTDELRELNRQVEEGTAPSAAAAAWLVDHGITS